MKKALIFLLITLCYSVVKAQYPYYEDDRFKLGIQVGVDYDNPLNKLGSTYKPAVSPNFSLLFSQFDNFTANITAAYFVYQPKAPEFNYLTDDGENYRTDIYSAYKSKALYVGFLYHLGLGKHIKASAGLNFGAYFTHYELSTNDPQQNSVYDIHSLNVYGSPKLVLSAALNDFISLNIQGKYNVFAPTGNNNGFTPSYDSEFGSVYTSWSYGIGISYKF